MFDRHTLCYATLTAVHGVTGIVLMLEGAAAEAISAFVAAIVYAALTHGSAHPVPGGESHRPAKEETQEYDLSRPTGAG